MAQQQKRAALFPQAFSLSSLTPSLPWRGWLPPWLLSILSLPSPASYNQWLTSLPRCPSHGSDSWLSFKSDCCFDSPCFWEGQPARLKPQRVFLLPSPVNAISKIFFDLNPYEGTPFFSLPSQDHLTPICKEAQPNLQFPQPIPPWDGRPFISPEPAPHWVSNQIALTASLSLKSQF